MRAALVEHLDRLAAAGATTIVSPAREVLGDQDQFAHAAFGERAALREYLVGRARALVTSERRDGAEAAATVTPLGDLDVGPGRRRLRSRQVQEVEGRERSGAQRHRRRRDDRRQTLPESGDEVDFGQRRREFVTVALGHAARDDESRVGLFHVREREDRLDGLLARGFDEGVGAAGLGAGAGHASVALVSQFLGQPEHVRRTQLPECRIKCCLSVLGIIGLYVTLSKRARFQFDIERGPYIVFFLGVLFTAVGSGYYHLAPDNTRLFWDRLPMTVALMGLISSQIVDRISIRAGIALLLPMLLVGAASVIYWRVTENAGAGNVMPYGILQGYSVVILLAITALMPSRYTLGNYLYWVFAWYVASKFLETFDRGVFGLGHLVSGHTLKHLAAAIAAVPVFLMLMRRTLVTGGATQSPEVGGARR